MMTEPSSGVTTGVKFHHSLRHTTFRDIGTSMNLTYHGQEGIDVHNTEES